MKKLGFVLLVLMAAFATLALTGGNPPVDPPVCPEGTIMVEKPTCIEPRMVCPEDSTQFGGKCYQYVPKNHDGSCPEGYKPSMLDRKKCVKEVEKVQDGCLAWSKPVCREECAEGYTYEFEGLSSPGPWNEWEFDGEEFNRCRVIKTAIQHRDETTDKICSVESRQEKQCETHPDACTNLEGGQFEVPEGYILVEGICVKKPPELEAVTVGVNITCGSPASDGVVYQTFFGLTVNPAGGAVLTFDGQDYTESAGGHAGFGKYPWSAIANKGYIIDGPSEGEAGVKRGDCNKEKPPETGGGDPTLFVAGMSLIGLVSLGAGALWLRKRDE